MKKSLVLASIISLFCISSTGFGGFNAMWGADGTGNSGTNMFDPTLNEDGKTYSLSETLTIDDDAEGENCIIDFDLTYDPDPWVQGGFSVTNTAAFAQTFTFTFTSPVDPDLTGSTLYGGQMSGSFSSDLFTGATVSTVSGTPLYEGFIDGASSLSFYPDPDSWSIPVLSSGSIPSKDQPITLSGPSPVTTDLEIVFTFTLTPGDVATMNGRLEVVPEPATMMLLGLGGLLLRRRK